MDDRNEEFPEGYVCFKMEKEDFFRQINEMLGGDLSKHSNQRIYELLTLTDYIRDMVIIEGTARRIVTEHEGMANVNSAPALPDGVEFLETVLTTPMLQDD